MTAKKVDGFWEARVTDGVTMNETEFADVLSESKKSQFVWK